MSHPYGSLLYQPVGGLRTRHWQVLNDVLGTMDHLSFSIDGSRLDSSELQPKAVLLPQPVNEFSPQS